MKGNIELDFNPKKILRDLSKYGILLQKYIVVVSVLIIVGLYGFLILQISSATQQEPSDEDVALKLSTVKRLNIDEDAIAKIETLKDQNIVVQALFESARNNPFKED